MAFQPQAPQASYAPWAPQAPRAPYAPQAPKPNIPSYINQGYSSLYNRSNEVDPYKIQSISDVLFNKEGQKRAARKAGYDADDYLTRVLVSGVQYVKNQFVKPILAGNVGEVVRNSLISISRDVDMVANPFKGMIIESGSENIAAAMGLLGATIAGGAALIAGGGIGLALTSAIVTSGMSMVGTSVLNNPEDAVKGFIKGSGLGNTGRHEYLFDYGNWGSNLLAEIVVDPLNWGSFGLKALNKLASESMGYAVNKTTLNVFTAISKLDDVVTKVGWLGNPLGGSLKLIKEGVTTTHSLYLKQLMPMMSSYIDNIGKHTFKEVNEVYKALTRVSKETDTFRNLHKGDGTIDFIKGDTRDILAWTNAAKNHFKRSGVAPTDINAKIKNILNRVAHGDIRVNKTGKINAVDLRHMGITQDMFDSLIKSFGMGIGDANKLVGSPGRKAVFEQYLGILADTSDFVDKTLRVLKDDAASIETVINDFLVKSHKLNSVGEIAKTRKLDAIQATFFKRFPDLEKFIKYDLDGVSSLDYDKFYKQYHKTHVFELFSTVAERYGVTLEDVWNHKIVGETMSGTFEEALAKADVDTYTFGLKKLKSNVDKAAKGSEKLLNPMENGKMLFEVYDPLLKSKRKVDAYDMLGFIFDDSISNTKIIQGALDTLSGTSSYVARSMFNEIKDDLFKFLSLNAEDFVENKQYKAILEAMDSWKDIVSTRAGFNDLLEEFDKIELGKDFRKKLYNKLLEILPEEHARALSSYYESLLVFKKYYDKFNNVPRITGVDKLSRKKFSMTRHMMTILGFPDEYVADIAKLLDGSDNAFAKKILAGLDDIRPMKPIWGLQEEVALRLGATGDNFVAKLSKHMMTLMHLTELQNSSLIGMFEELSDMKNPLSMLIKELSSMDQGDPIIGELIASAQYVLRVSDSLNNYSSYVRNLGEVLNNKVTYYPAVEAVNKMSKPAVASILPDGTMKITQGMTTNGFMIDTDAIPTFRDFKLEFDDAVNNMSFGKEMELTRVLQDVVEPTLKEAEDLTARFVKEQDMSILRYAEAKEAQRTFDTMRENVTRYEPIYKHANDTKIELASKRIPPTRPRIIPQPLDGPKKYANINDFSFTKLFEEVFEDTSELGKLGISYKDIKMGKNLDIPYLLRRYLRLSSNPKVKVDTTKDVFIDKLLAQKREITAKLKTLDPKANKEAYDVLKEQEKGINKDLIEVGTPGSRLQNKVYLKNRVDYSKRKFVWLNAARDPDYRKHLVSHDLTPDEITYHPELVKVKERLSLFFPTREIEFNSKIDIDEMVWDNKRIMNYMGINSSSVESGEMADMFMELAMRSNKKGEPRQIQNLILNFDRPVYKGESALLMNNLQAKLAFSKNKWNIAVIGPDGDLFTDSSKLAKKILGVDSPGGYYKSSNLNYKTDAGPLNAFRNYTSAVRRAKKRLKAIGRSLDEGDEYVSSNKKISKKLAKDVKNDMYEWVSAEQQGLDTSPWDHYKALGIEPPETPEVFINRAMDNYNRSRKRTLGKKEGAKAVQISSLQDKIQKLTTKINEFRRSRDAVAFLNDRYFDEKSKVSYANLVGVFEEYHRKLTNLPGSPSKEKLKLKTDYAIKEYQAWIDRLRSSRSLKMSYDDMLDLAEEEGRRVVEEAVPKSSRVYRYYTPDDNIFYPEALESSKNRPGWYTNVEDFKYRTAKEEYLKFLKDQAKGAPPEDFILRHEIRLAEMQKIADKIDGYLAANDMESLLRDNFYLEEQFTDLIANFKREYDDVYKEFSEVHEGVLGKEREAASLQLEEIFYGTNVEYNKEKNYGAYLKRYTQQVANKIGNVKIWEKAPEIDVKPKQRFILPPEMKVLQDEIYKSKEKGLGPYAEDKAVYDYLNKVRLEADEYVKANAKKGETFDSVRKSLESRKEIQYPFGKKAFEFADFSPVEGYPIKIRYNKFEGRDEYYERVYAEMAAKRKKATGAFKGNIKRKITRELKERASFLDSKTIKNHLADPDQPFNTLKPEDINGLKEYRVKRFNFSYKSNEIAFIKHFEDKLGKLTDVEVEQLRKAYREGLSYEEIEEALKYGSKLPQADGGFIVGDSNKFKSLGVQVQAVSEPLIAADVSDELIYKAQNSLLDMLEANHTELASDVIKYYSIESITAKLLVIPEMKDYPQLVEVLAKNMNAYVESQAKIGANVIQLPDKDFAEGIQELLQKKLPDFLGTIDNYDVRKGFSLAKLNDFKHAYLEPQNFSDEEAKILAIPKSLKKINDTNRVMSSVYIHEKVPKGEVGSNIQELMMLQRMIGGVKFENHPRYARAFERVKEGLDAFSNPELALQEKRAIRAASHSVGHTKLDSERLTERIIRASEEIPEIVEGQKRADDAIFKEVYNEISERGNGTIGEHLNDLHVKNMDLLDFADEVATLSVKYGSALGDFNNSKGFIKTAKNMFTTLSGLSPEDFSRYIYQHTNEGLMIIDKDSSIIGKGFVPGYLQELVEKHGMQVSDTAEYIIIRGDVSFKDAYEPLNQLPALGRKGLPKDFLEAGDKIANIMNNSSKIAQPISWTDGGLMRVNGESLKNFLLSKGALSVEEAEDFAFKIQKGGLLNTSMVAGPKLMGEMFPEGAPRPTSPMNMLLNSMYSLTGHASTKYVFLRHLFDKQSAIGSVLGEDAQIAFDVFKKEKNLQVIFMDTKGRLQHFVPKTVKDMAHAIKHDMTITSYTGMVNFYKKLDTFELKGIMGAIDKFVNPFFKAGYFLSAGLALRNMMDTPIRAMITKQMSLTDIISSSRDTWRHISEFSRMVKEIGDITDKRAVVDYLSKQSREQIDMFNTMMLLYDFKVTGAPMSAILDVTAEKRMLDAAAGFTEKHASIVQEAVWNFPLLKWSLGVVGKTEEFFRTSMALHLLKGGASMDVIAHSNAMQFVDYSFKSPFIKTAGAFIPFAQFAFSNAALWADHATDNPALFKILIQMGTESYVDEKQRRDQAYSEFETSIMASGNLKVGNDLWKWNPSLFDAMTAIPGMATDTMRRITPALKNIPEILRGNFDAIEYPFEAPVSRAYKAFTETIPKAVRGESLRMGEIAPTIVSSFNEYPDQHYPKKQYSYNSGISNYNSVMGYDKSKMSYRYGGRVFYSSNRQRKMYISRGFYSSLYTSTGKSRIAIRVNSKPTYKNLAARIKDQSYRFKKVYIKRY